MIETRLLHYFLIVAREQNVTSAAKILHITQPTLSRQMSILEEQVGTTLFHRGSRPLTLTDEGFLLRRRAEEILSLLEKTEAELSVCEEQVEGVISIGCGELASVSLLTEWIAEFQKKYPRVTFDVYTAVADQIRQRMDNGLTDIGLLLEPVDMEHYDYLRMPVKERWVALMPIDAPLAKRESVRASDLEGFPVILPSRRIVLNEVANWFGDSYEKIEIAAVSNLSTNTALLVRAGLGYSLSVEGSLPFFDQSEVCMVPLSPELTSTSVLAWKRGQPFSTAVRYFLDYIKCLKGMKQE